MAEDAKDRASVLLKAIEGRRGIAAGLQRRLLAEAIAALLPPLARCPGNGGGVTASRWLREISSDERGDISTNCEFRKR
jgi:hypothetical protein